VILARAQWAGRRVRCPHCSAELVLPPDGKLGETARAGAAKRNERRFAFGCTRCESLLEANTGMSGGAGRCPTCGARFLVPFVDASGRVDPLQLIDANDQDPTPIHAYASSGTQAPIIHRGPDDTLHIECPRCHARSAIEANNCTQCGVPFTIDGAPTIGSIQADALGRTAVILGILSVPLFMVIVPGVLAVALGVGSLRRAPAARMPAIVGLTLGLGSLAGAVVYYAG
jgi:DNA-directed RNA polymerase subunit RPC12/RpoP